MNDHVAVIHANPFRVVLTMHSKWSLADAIPYGFFYRLCQRRYLCGSIPFTNDEIITHGTRHVFQFDGTDVPSFFLLNSFYNTL